MSCPFKVSDKVVSLITFTGANGLHINIGEPPMKDAVYVVERNDMGWSKDGLKLVGRQTIHRLTGIEVGWAHFHFRKLEEVQAENRARQAVEATP